MIKKYLHQLGQLGILNFVFFILLFMYLNNKTNLNLLNKTQKQNVVTPVIINTNQSTSTFSSSSSSSVTPFSQLPSHSTQADCWMAIDGHIYDITAYFGSHPGGDPRLLAYCGRDASAAYHTKDGQGRDHSSQALAILNQFIIQ